MKQPFFCLLFFSFFFCRLSFAQPTGFVDEQISDHWNIPVGLTFDKQGRMYVWEKAGKIFMVENGVKNPVPIIDISKEVLDFNDHGLNGVALDPDFLNNGYIYLLYAVKRHHVLYFGTPAYDSTNADGFKTTIGRLTRYTLNKTDGFKTVDENSRKILLGESITTGIPILVDNHGVGSLVFGKDGTLLVTAGDAALASEPPSNDSQNPWFLEAVSVGIITADQNVNAYRSQVLNSLNGKILRIDPATGNGLTSNPFYEAGNPRSAKSRIWAYGLRNPFRFTVQPNTGSTNPADGNPGTIFAGDVGWSHREEINIISRGGQNFGWPLYEGISYTNESYNNPVYKPTTPVLPIIEWRGPLAQALVDGEVYGVGSAQFKGNPFSGNSSIGGIFYNMTTFPEAYRNLYFQGDYEGWVKAFRLDEKNNPVEVIDFTDRVNPTCFALNPVDGSIYYVSYLYPDIHEVRRLSFNPNANLRPVIVAEAAPVYGTSPLTVNFTASNSRDPENGPLTFFWDFGDGKSSDLPNPTHIYVAVSTEPQIFTAILKVTDNEGKSDSKTFKIYLNNTPPTIVSTSIDNINSFNNAEDFKVNLTANVTDKEQTDLSYQWVVVLHHEEHTHFVNSFRKSEGQVVLGQVPCDSQTYFYRISLIVTDPLGLNTTYDKDIKPLCPGDSISNPDPDPEPVILSVYPNPTKNAIELMASNDLDNHLIKLILLRNTGQVISEREGYWRDLKEQINRDLSDQSSGIYILNVTFGDKNKIFRIYKE
ncbi:PQQ-dependent sugar dehydrogenase [Emticicia sp. BO119]|uniref:PQQ-dependent sugar dehydrogenase n=1 Tax=Emticicia sp. BO119 TaxID=2757768 RepID=UPI0015F1052D|nr:PQQ-dependent sugar dehydrogenase [Emticicia sp. BO119]MBA4853219.1 PQQ-dependent sugar dehydrogenase [Emticicia sp. BO119]